MTSITLRDLGVLAPAPLFQHLNLTIGGADRLGLVAGNGAGKSTLLRCLAGTAEPGAGSITRSRGLRAVLVEQDVPPRLLDLPMADAVRRALPADGRGAQAWRVGAVLDGFGAPAALRALPVRALSGGWQRLVLIARAWVAEPDLLLLDEPTNHLDLAHIQVLEAWLAGSAGRLPLVVASHDRRFLDMCTGRTLFLRPDRCRLYDHPYTQARRLLAEDEAAEAARFARDSREADRLRRSAAELRNIGINSRSDKAQRKSMLMANRAEKLERTLHQAQAEKPGRIRLDSRDSHARVLASFDGLAVSAPDGRALFRVPRLALRAGDRLVLLGRNGAGKSQLMRLLASAARGTEVPGLRVSPSVVPGVLDQGVAHLSADDTPHGIVAGRFRLGDARSRSLLAGAGIPVTAQGRPIGVLSPGQRARLGLLVLRLEEPNLFLLDEPTVHVDIPGQEALEAEILAQGAACVLVSHDRSFVEAVGTRFLLIEHGMAEEVDGPERFYRGLLAREH